MKNIKKILILSVLAASFSACEKSKVEYPRVQKESIKGDVIEDQVQPDGNWYVKDPILNKVEGVGSERAQTEFTLKNQREIIVAVIDSGVDIMHEDLKNKIWNNPGEVGVDANGKDKRTNQIDDDQNGYVDDVYGWNFIGSKDGRHVAFENVEVTRESLRYDKKIANGDTLTTEEKAYFEKVNADYNKQRNETEENLKGLVTLEASAIASKKILKDKINMDDYSSEKLEAIVSEDADVLKAKVTLQEITKNFRSVARFFRILDYERNSLNYNLNKNFNAREIVGDDPDDFNQADYGNNDVTGPDASHGTHVSGIIAAERNNGLGINGIAQNVKIMALKVVPNGDERDKDIVMAIRYAIKNGAQIINMSFGKKYSPSKEKIDEAFLKASEKGILIFHAAGNDASNNDEVTFYPNRRIMNSPIQSAVVPNWLEVGASAQIRGLKMVAPFSDFGKKDVDLFSPGYELNSSIPGNKYAVYSGTSMASPAAAGVGALLMSNFDAMTAAQAKAILLHETRQYPELLVHLPGSQALDLPVPFAGLSATGGVIDAFKSIRFARELAN